MKKPDVECPKCGKPAYRVGKGRWPSFNERMCCGSCGKRFEMRGGTIVVPEEAPTKPVLPDLIAAGLGGLQERSEEEVQGE